MIAEPPRRFGCDVAGTYHRGSASSGFVRLAESGVLSFREYCRRFEISPTTSFNGWRGRRRRRASQATGANRRVVPGCTHRTMPRSKPRWSALRQQQPTWGGRTAGGLAADRGHPGASASTITAILRRHGLLDEARATGPSPPPLRPSVAECAVADGFDGAPAVGRWQPGASAVCAG